MGNTATVGVIPTHFSDSQLEEYPQDQGWTKVKRRYGRQEGNLRSCFTATTVMRMITSREYALGISQRSRFVAEDMTTKRFLNVLFVKVTISLSTQNVRRLLWKRISFMESPPATGQPHVLKGGLPCQQKMKYSLPGGPQPRTQ